MNTQSNLQRWERYAEWPLAAAALLFLGLFSVQVLARPHGREAYVLWVISWIVWGLFIVDYVVRLYLASNRWHWFVRHLLDFAIVALPLVRPLRLLRLLVLIEVLQSPAPPSTPSERRCGGQSQRSLPSAMVTSTRLPTPAELSPCCS
jgi:voltage-gated potassium channel